MLVSTLEIIGGIKEIVATGVRLGRNCVEVAKLKGFFVGRTDFTSDRIKTEEGRGGISHNQIKGNVIVPLFQPLAASKFEFKDEDVTSYEVGAKLTLLDGSAQFSINWFRSEFDNLQVSTINATTATFNVGNAASSTTTGVEADVKWALSDRLFFNAAFAYLHVGQVAPG